MLNRLRNLLVDGVLLALPLGVAAFLLHKAVSLLIDVLAPMSNLLPQARWRGIAALDIAAVLALLLVLMALGAFSRSALGRRIAATIEGVVLSKFPGYMMIKSMAADFGGTEQETGLRPALVSFDDNQVLGFVVEGAGDAQQLTVFVPGAPSAASGSVVLMPRERVQLLDASMASARKAMKQRGIGLQELVQAQRPGTSPGSTAA